MLSRMIDTGKTCNSLLLLVFYVGTGLALIIKQPACTELALPLLRIKTPSEMALRVSFFLPHPILRFGPG
jgi:energy-converting hydrogenase Eha subunit A